MIYSGIYDTVFVPNHNSRCVKVAFPLPNGNATVILRPEIQKDGSLKLISDGKKIGDPGFYFYLKHTNGKEWARFVKSVKEIIHVFVDEEGLLRTDHVLKYYNQTVFSIAL